MCERALCAASGNITCHDRGESEIITQLRNYVINSTLSNCKRDKNQEHFNHVFGHSAYAQHYIPTCLYCSFGARFSLEYCSLKNGRPIRFLSLSVFNSVFPRLALFRVCPLTFWTVLRRWERVIFKERIFSCTLQRAF